MHFFKPSPREIVNRVSNVSRILMVMLHYDLCFVKISNVTNPLIPSNVLLAKSTKPPAGRATTPTTPFPSPLKNPAAPPAFAPVKMNDK